jgi:peptidylprolyl isomerase
MWLIFSSWMAGSVACHDDETVDEVGSSDQRAIRTGVAQIEPPLELAKPPADAMKTASGLSYKTLVTNRAGAQPKRTDTALVQYTGWIQRTGVTFFSTRGRGRPIALEIAHAAPGFAEVLPLLRKGEKVVLWVPPSQGTPEATVYEIELVEIAEPPASTSHTATRPQK